MHGLAAKDANLTLSRCCHRVTVALLNNVVGIRFLQARPTLLDDLGPEGVNYTSDGPSWRDPRVA
jgi:hypothetical protein